MPLMLLTMRIILAVASLFISLAASAFVSPASSATATATATATAHSQAISSSSTTSHAMSASAHHPFCDLPGDPSLILTTNVDLGDKKMGIMKGE
jgi:hypothetical protein